MLSKIFRNATSSSADAGRGGCELLEENEIELFNVQTFFTVGDFQIGISRMFSESIKLQVVL